jgi:hypothetical protein
LGCKKSHRLPIKEGARARVKGFTTFEARTDFWGILYLPFVTLELLFLLLCSGTYSDFSDPPNIGAHRVSAEKTTHDATAEKVEEEHSC